MISIDALNRTWNDVDCYSEHAVKFWRRRALAVFLIVYLIVSLIACSAGTTSPKISSSSLTPARPTPTTLPKGMLLYQSDWSHGLLVILMT